MTNNILLIRVPAEAAVNGRDLRDYVLESLERGVLVLTDDASCEVIELPPLGGIKVLSIEPEVQLPCEEPQQPEAEAPPDTEDAVFRGHNLVEGTEGAEKRAILQMLQRYREVHGRGCLDTVAKATHTRGRITDNTLRMILTGDTQLSIEDWRIIGRALERLESKEGKT